MRLVILESPYAGTDDEITRNVWYGRRALADSLGKGEAPIASHLLYTQPGVLDDRKIEERWTGIQAGLAWGRVADASIFYVDYGISPGMAEGMKRAQREGRIIETRIIGKNDHPHTPIGSAT